MSEEKLIRLINVRLPRENKPYYERIIQEFAKLATEKNHSNYIEIGKQDIRGAYSISHFSDNHTIIQQMHFTDKKEMFGYIQGYIHALGNF